MIDADIARVRARIGSELLPGCVAELQALERAVTGGARGLNERWQALRADGLFRLSGAFAALEVMEGKRATLEAAQALEAPLVETWAERGPDVAEMVGKRAAANDR